jgi:hypothetical protein
VSALRDLPASRFVEVPRAVVERAERHYLRRRRPLLYGRRRRSEWRLTALPGASGRFAVLLDPECPAGRLILVASFMCGHRDDAILERLAKGAMAALADVPDCFRCNGREVGRWEVMLGSVFVRGPVALSCLSWVLHDQRVGFFLTLSGGATD